MALRVRICRRDQIAPDAINAFAVTGVTWPVIVTVVEGELVATAGVCPHDDVSLADGRLEDAMIVCPGHGYRFDLHTGRCQHNPGLVLRRYPVTLVDDEIWVDLL